MNFFRLTFVIASLFSVSVAAQTITTKFQLNPLHIQEVLPITVGASIEVTISPRSSCQISGLYRVDKTEYGVTKGPKYYLDYRYYFNRLGSSAQSFYVSPFLGIGRLDLANEDDILGLSEIHILREQFAGILLGYQPYKTARFSFDLYGGPEYQWRIETHSLTNSVNQLPYQLTKNRSWFRAGLSVCFRLKK